MPNSQSTSVSFANLALSDLKIDVVYCGGSAGTAADDPISKLVPVGNSGGFRYSGQVPAPRLVCLCSSGKNVDWPDKLDPETGLYTYYGDNRTPGSELLDTPRRGNRILTAAFGDLHSSPPRREAIPPFLVFESTGHRRDNRFLGVAVPGGSEIEAADDLVALWRTSNGLRFQNYRATFTILDIPTVSRPWLDAILAGNPLGPECPQPFAEWVATGSYQALRAPRTLAHRTRDEQLPQDLELLDIIHQRYQADPYEFEACATVLWRMHHGPGVRNLQLTRRSADGGRDATGVLALGPDADPIHIDFALEAKCYRPTNPAGVGDLKRLISRLRHRQFGVFVTTSYVGPQAYKEIREDQHPVVVLAGTDIVDTLRNHGISTPSDLHTWLRQDFRADLR